MEKRNDRDEFVGAAEAARRLGLSMLQVKRLGQRGVIGVREFPGVRRAYSAADIERLARSAVRPAQTSA